MTHPNIIFIMADDMGYGDLGCYGATRIPTSNMDRVATEGVRLTDTHSSSAVCSPSRYAVLTGRYCWRTGMEQWVLGGFGAPLIEPGRMTVASLLKSAGYRTAAIGKWHVGLNWQREDGNQDMVLDFGNPAWSVDGLDIDYSARISGGPTELGFDYFYGMAGSLDMAPYCFIENDRTAGIPDREKEVYFNQQRSGLQTADWRDNEVDIRLANRAVGFIESSMESDPDSPFFLYLTPSAPHRPCDTRPEFVIGSSAAGDRGDMVVLVDWVVGQVLDALDRLDIVDNTLIIVTSDNGGRAVCADGRDYGHAVNGPLRGQKADIWDGGHREPFVARWPQRIPAGSTSGELVCLADMMATFAAITGAELPDDAGEDSYNILPALTNVTIAEPIREALVHHSGNGVYSIRQGRWKLVFGLGSGGFSEPVTVKPTPDGPQGQLYDMEADLAEERNLWREHPEIVADLTALLERYRQEGRSRS